MGWRPTDDLGHEPGNLSDAGYRSQGSGPRSGEGSIHRQVQRVHIRWRKIRIRIFLSLHRISRQDDEAAGEVDAAEGPGTGASRDQAGERYQFQSRHEEGWPDY